MVTGFIVTYNFGAMRTTPKSFRSSELTDRAARPYSAPRFLALLGVLCLFAPPLLLGASRNRIETAKEIIRVLYPEFNGRKLVIQIDDYDRLDSERALGEFNIRLIEPGSSTPPMPGETKKDESKQVFSAYFAFPIADPVPWEFSS